MRHLWILPLGSLFLLMLPSYRLFVAEAMPTKNQSCIPIGRILNAPRRDLVGQVVCQDRQVILGVESEGKRSQIRVLCYGHLGIVERPSNELEAACKRLPQAIRSCVYTEGPGCLQVKGEISPLRILDPYSSVLVDERPKIAWKGSGSAVGYRVALVGPGVSWSRETREAEISYPADQPGLTAGGVYHISVIALNENGERLLMATEPLLRLGEPQLERLKQDLEVLYAKVARPDLYRELTLLYTSEGLYTEGIHVLEELAKQEQNPIAYQYLAELLTSTEQLERAAESYQKAIYYAEKSKYSGLVAELRQDLAQVRGRKS